jgi:hypothetical protein
VLEEGVGRVVSAEGGAIGSDREARLAHGVDERDDFARYVVVILRLEPAAMEGMRSLV